MTNPTDQQFQQVHELSNRLGRTINEFTDEHDIPLAVAIGCLEVVKQALIAQILNPMLTDQPDEPTILESS